MIAAPMGDQAKMVQADGMIRRGGENLPVDLVRFAEAIRAKIFERQNHGLVDRSALAGFRRGPPRRQLSFAWHGVEVPRRAFAPERKA
jgi:hypothetical protein